VRGGNTRTNCHGRKNSKIAHQHSFSVTSNQRKEVTAHWESIDGGGVGQEKGRTTGRSSVGLSFQVLFFGINVMRENSGNAPNLLENWNQFIPISLLKLKISTRISLILILIPTR